MKKNRPRCVEAMGYLVKEDRDGVYLSSSISGPLYSNILFIPKGAVVKKMKNNVPGYIEISYIEAQGINKQMTVEKLNSLSKPPVVKLCGFLAEEDDKNIYVAQEKNEDGKFRTITAVIRSLVVNINIKKPRSKI